MKTDNPYPFIIDDRTRRELGDEGMRDLAAHLWAKDCQRCGWQLGQTRPTVVIEDLMIFISAGLYHERCRAAQWHDSGAVVLEPGRHLSWDALPLRLTGSPSVVGGLKPTSPATDMPLLLLNPGLESVTLKRIGDSWRVNTLDLWRRVGLMIPTRGTLIDGKRPVANIRTELREGELVVTAEAMGPGWTVTCDAGYEAAMRGQGGVILAVTTAAVPSTLRTLDDLSTLLHQGLIAAGWLSLPEGAIPELQEPEPVPTVMATFVLHWGPGHATVGELLATADPSLPLARAQTWADDQIRAFTLTALPWEREATDPDAWSRLDPLAAIFYFLRRHPDGWKLLQIIVRRGGDNLADPDARDWATRAVRRRGAAQILTWISTPTTRHGFTTLHGTAPVPARLNPAT